MPIQLTSFKDHNKQYSGPDKRGILDCHIHLRMARLHDCATPTPGNCFTSFPFIIEIRAQYLLQQISRCFWRNTQLLLDRWYKFCISKSVLSTTDKAATSETVKLFLKALLMKRTLAIIYIFSIFHWHIKYTKNFTRSFTDSISVTAYQLQNNAKL